jgi:Asp-tRNA(Asn)/Glu-tRNA(Gln) amidotransferase A subunit family amidase
MGPITQCVADAALVLQAIAGYDPDDPTSSQHEVPDFVSALESPVKTLRVGVPRSFFFEGLDASVASAVENAIATITRLAASVEDVSLEVPTDRALQSAESFAYHAALVAKTPEMYQPETLRRIRSGSEISGQVLLEKSEELCRHRTEIQNVFRGVDVLITPTIPIPPPRLQELLDHPENLRPAELLLLRNTRPFNVWGLPSLSMPCGSTRDGLPVGLQFSAAAWREDLVLALARAYERARG